MNTVTSWQTALVLSWVKVWGAFLNLLPTVLGAVIVFTLGLILAFWVKRFVIEVLAVLKLEKFSKSSGIETYLAKAGTKKSLTELVGALAEWLIILTFFLAVVDILGLSVVSNVLARVLGYVPNIVAAALIFGAGYFVAGFVEGLVRGALASVDHEIAKPSGKVSRWLVILISFFAAVEQLQIAKGLIATFFQGLTYTIVLVVGLSLGLGSKDVVSEVLKDWYKKVKND